MAVLPAGDNWGVFERLRGSAVDGTPLPLVDDQGQPLPIPHRYLQMWYHAYIDHVERPTGPNQAVTRAFIEDVFKIGRNNKEINEHNQVFAVLDDKRKFRSSFVNALDFVFAGAEMPEFDKVYARNDVANWLFSIADNGLPQQDPGP